MSNRSLIYGLFFITLALPVFIYLQQKLLFMDVLLHSDALYGPFLIEDVLKDFSNYGSWHVSPNPALFPDFLGYGIAYLMTRDHYLSVPIYMVYQLTLLGVVLYGLYRHFFNQELALATTLLIVSGLLGITVAAAGPPYSYLIMSGHHIGNFTMLLAVLWVFFNLVDGHHTIRDTTLLVLIVLLASLSDRLIIVNTVVPIALITLLLLTRRQLTPAFALRVLAVLALGSAGMLLSKYTMPYEVNYASYGFGPSIYKIPSGLEILVEVLKQSFEGTPRWLSILLLSIGTITVSLAVFRSARSFSKPSVAQQKPEIFALFVLLSIGCAIAAPVIHATVFPRYLMPLFLLPLVLAPVLVVRNGWLDLPLTRRIMIALALCPIFTNLYIVQKDNRQLHWEYYPPDVACIDSALSQLQVTYGIAQYWDARYIAAYASQSRPEITHVYPNLQPYRWMISETQFRDRYDFAIIHLKTYPIYTLNERYLVELNGPPSHVAHCGARKLLAYKDRGLTTGG